VRRGLADYNIETKLAELPDFIGDDFGWAIKMLDIFGLSTDEVIISSRNQWTLSVCKGPDLNIETAEHPIFLNGVSATLIREKIRQGEEYEDLLSPSVYEYLNCVKLVDGLTGVERIRQTAQLPV
jgi:hypothetical protein